MRETPKRHWRGKSRMEDIESSLVDLVNIMSTRGIRSIAVPPLGAGLASLPDPSAVPPSKNPAAKLLGAGFGKPWLTNSAEA